MTRYGDGQAELANVLRTGLSSATEPVTTAARVNTRIPQNNAPYGDVTPLVVVRQDGNGRDQEVRTIVAYRVTLWAGTEDDTYDLAQICHEILLQHSGGAVVTHVLPELTPDVMADPDTNEPMGYFTVRGKLRPITGATQ